MKGAISFRIPFSLVIAVGLLVVVYAGAQDGSADTGPTPARDAAAAKRRLEEGFQFIAVASEAGLMLSKAQEVIRTLGLGSAKTVAKY